MSHPFNLVDAPLSPLDVLSTLSEQEAAASGTLSGQVGAVEDDDEANVPPASGRRSRNSGGRSARTTPSPGSRGGRRSRSGSRSPHQPPPPLMHPPSPLPLPSIPHIQTQNAEQDATAAALMERYNMQQKKHAQLAMHQTAGSVNRHSQSGALIPSSTSSSVNVNASPTPIITDPQLMRDVLHQPARAAAGMSGGTGRRTRRGGKSMNAASAAAASSAAIDDTGTAAQSQDADNGDTERDSEVAIKTEDAASGATGSAAASASSSSALPSTMDGASLLLSSAYTTHSFASSGALHPADVTDEKIPGFIRKTFNVSAKHHDSVCHAHAC